MIPGIFAVRTPVLLAADLQQDTVQAYERYIQATEARVEQDDRLPDRWLYIDSLPEPARSRTGAELKRGGIWLDSLETRDEAGRVIRAPHGLITHWIGAVFFPGATLRQALGVIQDYDHYQDIYKPQIVRSRLLNRQGETFEAFFRAYKETPWVDITLNVNSRVTFSMPDSLHASSRNVSTRIAQVENAGRPDEHEDSVGHDGGYIWRLNSYWRFEERDGGVVAEWEAITLSRDIPFLLRWLVRPFVERLARATLRDTLDATRKEVRKRARAARSEH